MGLDWGLKDSRASVRQGYRGRGLWADGIPLQRHKGVKNQTKGRGDTLGGLVGAEVGKSHPARSGLKALVIMACRNPGVSHV